MSSSKWTDVDVQVTIKGRYAVENGLVTVECGLGSNTTQVGGSPPQTLARLMINEMVPNDQTPIGRRLRGT
jgi:hypothetical protein